jgi:AcrR family transcriptional regulator
LHYYFPTKEQLGEAVAQQLGYAFTTSPSPTLPHEEQTGSPREKMERYFASLVYQLQTTPERFVVMNELFLASGRDPQLAQTLAVDTNWQTYIMDILSGFRTTLTAAHLKCEGKRGYEDRSRCIPYGHLLRGRCKKVYRSDLTRGGNMLSLT